MVYKLALVDDDPIWNGAVKRFFIKHGFEVQTFTDAASFQDQASNYDIALIDFYLMPQANSTNEDNGYVMIRHLKQTLSRCPIMVLVSAFVDMESARLFPEADFFLVKDIGLDVILQRTQELLQYRCEKTAEPV